MNIHKKKILYKDLKKMPIETINSDNKKQQKIRLDHRNCK